MRSAFLMPLLPILALLSACAVTGSHIEARTDIQTFEVSLSLPFLRQKNFDFLMKCWVGKNPSVDDTVCTPEGKHVSALPPGDFQSMGKPEELDDGSTMEAFVSPPLKEGNYHPQFRVSRVAGQHPPAVIQAASEDAVVYARFCDENKKACIFLLPSVEETLSVGALLGQSLKFIAGSLWYGKSIVQAFFTNLHFERLLKAAPPASP